MGLDFCTSPSSAYVRNWISRPGNSALRAANIGTQVPGQVPTLIEPMSATLALILLQLQMVADMVVHVGQAMRSEAAADEAVQLLLLPACVLINRDRAAVVVL